MFRTKRFALLIILLLALTALAVIRGCNRSRPVPESVAESTALPDEAPPVTETPAAAPKAAAENTTASAQTAAETEPAALTRYDSIRERMELLGNSCSDFIGWLYIADTDIDLPVVQGSDNDYYLSHAPDGTYHRAGTIFLDCRSSPDFSDPHNILYGHNMLSGMFGDIRYFKNRAEFDRHRCGWLFTPEQTYRIDFYALTIVSVNDVIYETDADPQAWRDCILEKARFTSEPLPEEGDRLIALSTCASDFASARALFTGKLVPVDDEDTVIAQINGEK